MVFLRNAWYAAAWEDEISPGAFFTRRILNEQILFVRDEEGVHALRDRCPHRFAPLHLGTLSAGVIECAYHGLRFNLKGECVLNPQAADGTPPRNARAQAYPVISRHMLVWIWMGAAAAADPSLIPEFQGLDPERFAINKGYMHTPANYKFMTDNIMDLSHIEFLHGGVLGSSAIREAETEVYRDGATVHSNRLTRRETLPIALEAVFQANETPVDRWLDVRWDPPGLMQIVVGVAPSGQPERIGPENPGVHLMTPETEETTHYFWSNSRNFRKEDTVLHGQMEQGLRYAFEEQDKPMILAQKEAMDGEDFWALRPLMLAGDAGAVQARRILQGLIEQERRAAAA